MMRSSASRRSPNGPPTAAFDASLLGDPLGITLSHDDHTYWYGDERVLGTWETFAELGLYHPSFYTEAGRDRGLRVHHRTAAQDAAADPAPPVLAEELGYCASWQQFVAVWTVLQWLLVERSLWEPRRRVAGTCDRVALAARPGTPRHVAIIDQKTGAEEPVHKYQLSVYELLVVAWLRVHHPEWVDLPRIRYAVYLREDGAYPKVRVFAFEPVVEALVAAAQVKRALAPRAR